MTKKLISTIFALTILFRVGYADEGMWLIHLVAKINGKTMQEMGLKMSPEDIYNVNQASLKDAVMAMGAGFCTAEIISDQGLLLTNHHCAYGNLQSFSSVDNDILTNGFWAKTLKDEKPVPGLFVTALQRIDDVTEQVLAKVTPDMNEMDRSNAIRIAITEVTNQNQKDGLQVIIRSFFEGNQYLMITNKIYRDIRLVGAPDESIGKFGGDTDNWMWPRHTGDFTLYRIYADEKNQPAEFNKNNKPFTPAWHLPVSLDGVKEGDFAMIVGYPGSTDRFLSSWGVNLALGLDQPARIKLRKQRLDAMKKNMDANPAVRIQYASKYAQVSNYYKYFIGQSKGLKDLDVYAKKLQIEKSFDTWVNENEERRAKYGDALPLLEKGYASAEGTKLAEVYHLEAGYASELPRFSFGFSGVLSTLKEIEAAKSQKKKDKKKIKELNARLKTQLADLKERAEAFHKDFDLKTDLDVTLVLYAMYQADIEKSQLPSFFTTIEENYEGSVERYVNEMFASSLAKDMATLNKFLKKPTAKQIEDDLAFQTASSIIAAVRNGNREAREFQGKGYRLFVAGLMEQQPDKKWYPNANSSMRLTYGQVLPYTSEGKRFNFKTYASQILEKENPEDPEFIVPAKLISLIKNSDYGIYKGANEKDLVVNFISNNDITGGNSGSPVINGNGYLIGCAFDGNWEAMSGDIAFEPELQRTISVDTRFMLFIIDKYAGARHLVEEMTLVLDGVKAKGKDLFASLEASNNTKEKVDPTQLNIRNIERMPLQESISIEAEVETDKRSQEAVPTASPQSEE
ncbi:MAG: S46 family peptidase [Luteibaculaceae bacterium]